MKVTITIPEFLCDWPFYIGGLCGAATTLSILVFISCLTLPGYSSKGNNHDKSCVKH